MIYDLCICGGGVSGIFAGLRIAEKKKSPTTLIIDVGRGAAKRRKQLDGWLGVFPNSDGKLYQNDIKKVGNIVGNNKAKKTSKYVKSVLKQFSDCKVIKDKGPSLSIQKKISNMGFDTELNDYIQFYPKEIHALSKYMANKIENSSNIELSFDNEIYGITKSKNIFTISTELGEFKCRKVIFCVGRSGWRFSQEIFEKFGLIEDDDMARFGIRVEMPSQFLKDFNNSSCILRKPEIEIGPFLFNGTVIPEDHLNCAISAFRSNENRWKTDKVSFQIIGNIHYPKNGFKQTNRIAELTFIMTDNRIVKERVSALLNKKSKISSLPDYEWIAKYIKDFSNIVPEILKKSYFHAPTVIPLPASINIGTNLETELDNFYVAGESAGVLGIYSAAIMGVIAADQAFKGK